MKGIYAGSFDMPTLGHEWMIKEGSKLFDKFIVAVGVNPDKKSMFTIDERMDMLSEILISNGDTSTSIEILGNEYLINYAFTRKCTHIIRGIRSVSDYEYEKAMRYINEDIALKRDITTVMLIPPKGLIEVSSSLVKGLIGPSGWENVVSRYVSDSVLERIIEKCS